MSARPSRPARRWALLLYCGLCGCPQPPSADSCATPATRDITAIELGAPASGSDADPPGLESPGDAPFTALSDGDINHLFEGSQGLQMMVLRLRVHAPSPPKCLSVNIYITNDRGTEVVDTQLGLNTYPQSDGTFTTRGIPLPSDYPESVIASATVGAVSTTRQLYTHEKLCRDSIACANLCAAGDLVCVSTCAGDVTSAEQTSELVAYQYCLWGACYTDAASAGSDGGSTSPPCEDPNSVICASCLAQAGNGYVGGDPSKSCVPDGGVAFCGACQSLYEDCR